MKDKSFVLFGYKDAHIFLGVSKTAFDKLIKRYDIPFHKTSSGRIFLKSDLVEFQNSSDRKENLKHRKKAE